MRRFFVLLVGVLILSLALTGCRFQGGQVPTGTGGVEGRTPTKAPSPPKGADGVERKLLVPIYFADWQVQHLIPEGREIGVPAGQAGVEPATLAALVLQELLAGPTDPHLLRTIPAGTRLLQGVRLADGVATVDLSREFVEMPGASTAALAVDSICLTLTEIEGIDRVEILVEGESGRMVGEGLLLSGRGRPFYGDWPVLPDPERLRYLQSQVSTGRELWRTDPTSLLQWEGRMFGFTSAELARAVIDQEGGRAEARIPYGGTIYLISLERLAEGVAQPIWSISAITTHKSDTGAEMGTVYFPNRQWSGVIPEARIFLQQEQVGARATAVVEALLAGPAERYLTRLFPVGIRLLEPVRVERGIALVNLSEQFQLAGDREATIILQGLVYSLTEIPAVSGVQLLVEGQTGAVVGHHQFSAPIHRQILVNPYDVDPERIAWLQARVEREPWRLDPVQTLMWEGRSFGFTPEVLKTAEVSLTAEGAVAQLDWQGRRYRFELGKNPGPEGIWYMKGLTEE